MNGQPTEKVRVMVVEDEAIVQLHLCRMLTGLGFEVVGGASSSVEALALAEEQKPALVLMDIELQGETNGIETAHLLNASYGPAIVFLTAYADEATVQLPQGVGDRERSSHVGKRLEMSREAVDLIQHVWRAHGLSVRSLDDDVHGADAGEPLPDLFIRDPYGVVLRKPQDDVGFHVNPGDPDRNCDKRDHPTDENQRLSRRSELHDPCCPGFPEPSMQAPTFLAQRPQPGGVEMRVSNGQVRAAAGAVGRADVLHQRR